MTVVEARMTDLVQEPIQDSRAGLHRDRVAYYLEHLDQAPPVTVFDIEGHLLLADGYHRVEAARQLGRGTIKAEVRQGLAGSPTSQDSTPRRRVTPHLRDLQR